MNRLFGSGKPKAPPPNLSDCVANVSMIPSYTEIRLKSLYTKS